MPRKVIPLPFESKLSVVETFSSWNPPDIDWASVLTGELLLCSLFARLLLNLPEEALLKPLIDEELFSELPFAPDQPLAVEGQQLLTEWTMHHKGGLEPDVVTDLKVDYTRLFSGGLRSPVAPWGSVFLNDERLLFQEQTLDVRAWYNRFDLKAVNQYREPDDHIGLELSFIAHLAKLALGEAERGDERQFDQLLGAQRTFLSQHLILWGPLWCSLVEEYAQSDFYRGLALVLHGALLELAALLDLPVPDLPGS